MLARGWLVILCATVLSAAAVVLSHRYLEDPVYAASTQVFAQVPGDAQTHAAYEGNRGSSVRMETYAQLATSSIVTQRTINELGLKETPEELAAAITVASVPGTLSPFSFPLSVLLSIQVSGSDQNRVVDIANAVARNLVATSQEVEWNAENNEPGPDLVLIDQAKTAYETGPSWVADAEFGAAVGLALSCLAVLATGVRRDRVMNRGHLAYVAEQSTGPRRTDESCV